MFNIQRNPVVAMDSAGRFVVVWQSKEQDQGPQSFAIMGRDYDSTGDPIGPEFLVNTFYESHQEKPSVAVVPAGGYVVVWQSNLQDGDGIGIYGQRFGP
jgi:hypothetical protein